MEKNKITEYIKEHPENFQLNFQYLLPKERIIDEKSITERMINVKKYQTNGYIIDRFYKEISRILK